MNFNGWGSFEDFARACGYTCGNNSNNNGGTYQPFNTGCYDIPNGFQCVNPDLFVIVGAILGEIMAGNLPSNVQNSLGNWLCLVGQVIVTYSAQQQYFQSGPGIYFDPRSFNINNPYCSTTQNGNSNNGNSNNGSSNGNNNIDKIAKLENQINYLLKEIESLKSKIDD